MRLTLIGLGVGLLLLALAPACSRYQKITSGTVEIELKTPTGQSGRGIGDITISRNRDAAAADRTSTCAGVVPYLSYQRLIKELNSAGFIYMNSRKPERLDGEPVYSLRVAEYRPDGPTRTNTVLWTGQNFPREEILLQLNHIRNDLKHNGHCTGVLPEGENCLRDEECRTSCCVRESPERQLCAPAGECEKRAAMR